MNVMSIITIIINVVCAVWLIGLGVFVIIKRHRIKKESKKELGEMYDGEVVAEQESIGKESKKD